jgi:hypothetical protein
MHAAAASTCLKIKIFAAYLEAIDDPTHPEHERMRIWGPERFDPNVIDRKARSRRQCPVREMEGTPHHHVIKIDVNQRVAKLRLHQN